MGRLKSLGSGSNDEKEASVGYVSSDTSCLLD